MCAAIEAGRIEFFGVHWNRRDACGRGMVSLVAVGKRLSASEAVPSTQI